MYFNEQLTINGKVYSRQELSLFNDLFIREWVSESEVIKVRTSGTTGEPKGITFLKSQAIESAKMTCEYFGLNKNHTALLCISTDFIGGKMLVVRAFVSGMNLIIAEPSHNPLTNINEKMDMVSLVPIQVHSILQDNETREKFSKISNVLIGGAPLSLNLENELANFPNNIYLSFAMTETLSHIALRKISGKDRTEYYEALPGISVSTDIRDCLVINAPLLNEKPIVTNDVVEIIDSKKFRWLGRFDDIINSGGIKIHPEMVERKLSSIISNHRFFISSLPDEKLGQKVVLCTEGITITGINKIKEQIKRVLSKYEVPKEYYSVKKFVETETGKINKKETLQELSII